MLMNLGLNGLQAMSESGELSFQLSLVALDQREISRRLLELEAGSYICIEVRDGGIGISPDVQERIFEPFFTTRERRSRTGLGLSTVHGVIQRHHGAIEVESQVGVGTTMRVFLPHDETLSLSIDSHSSERGRPNLSGLRVLIIDDEALIRQSLAAMLTSLEIDVNVAESGDEGLALLRASIAVVTEQSDGEQSDGEQTSGDRAITRAQYDLVILDMLMPDKSGHEVFLELITFAPHLPVILSSGYYPEGALEDMRARGLAGQLHKPYGLDEVSALIAQVLSQDLESER
jgi:CheY-like chemotaxis protein